MKIQTTLEELGVDRLFVDEAHSYKNLFLYTKMQNVAGLSTSDAQKSSDMFAKCRYMDELTGSRGVIFATGTPVSNSMTELYTMQQHIINYAKTRDVYVAYRKAGYSKKFLSEHESEIILHKAAKQFFDEQNLKKLPTVKSLQAEYAQLLSEKKAMYADYQKARENMRSLQTAKANVDRILNTSVIGEAMQQEKNGC